MMQPYRRLCVKQTGIWECHILFGGTAPASFDCSGFVCWVFSNSGVHNLPEPQHRAFMTSVLQYQRQMQRQGDIIFFTGTYNAGRPVTHVGIYCGNGTMVHCGDQSVHLNQYFLLAEPFLWFWKIELAKGGIIFVSRTDQFTA